MNAALGKQSGRTEPAAFAGQTDREFAVDISPTRRARNERLGSIGRIWCVLK